MALYSRKKGTENNILYRGKEEFYWRKANAIHKWFVDNIQEGIDDCGKYEVSKEQLIELVSIIGEILEEPNKVEQIKLAKELLPTCPGFFFGSYDYDSYYFETLENTYETLGILLNRINFNEYDIFYQSSW